MNKQLVVEIYRFFLLISDLIHRDGTKNISPSVWSKKKKSHSIINEDKTVTTG